MHLGPRQYGVPGKGVPGPAELWRTAPMSRKVDFVGVFSPGGEDAVLAVAKGAQPGGPLVELDQRATIRGGLYALQKLGKYTGDLTFLQSTALQDKHADRVLAHAAGAKTLASGAARVRHMVSAAGHKAERAAWGMRGIYILDTLAIMAKGRQAGTAAASMFGPIGMAVGAAMGLHGAISGEVAKAALLSFRSMVKSGIGVDPGSTVPAHGTRAPKPAKPHAPKTHAMTPPPSAAGFPWLPLLLGGGLLVLVVSLFRRKAA